MYAFVPTKYFAPNSEKIEKWKAMAALSVEEAPPALRNQLELQLKWLLDPSSGEAE